MLFALAGYMAVLKPDDKPVLVIIDVQKGWKEFHPGKWNNPGAVGKMRELLEFWRKKGWRVIHVRHDSYNPKSFLKEGKPTFEFQDEVKPEAGEKIVTKHVNSALIGTDLEETLRSAGADPVVFCGFVTDHCVSTTARMSGNLGFRTMVVEDACGTYSKPDMDGNEVNAATLHRANLASIHGEFATVLRSSDLVA